MLISILPLVPALLVGVAWTFPWRPHDDVAVFHPIVSRSDERRICVELCMSGLGGDPCGEDCVDLSPMNVPLRPRQSNHTYGKNIRPDGRKNRTQIGRPRNGSCPILCANNLGFPLCNCGLVESRRKQVDYVEICGHYCINYDYRIFGCQECDIYKNLSAQTMIPNALTASGYQAVPSTNMVLTALALDPFWTQWCVDKCSEGEGGSACNCDKPVMAVLY